MRVHTLELEIVAAGMVTSVGHDARTACAAIRAGISRSAPIHGYLITSLADHEDALLLGHPIVPITNGFLSVGRWLQLCRYALRDLLAQLGADAQRSQTAIYFWLPNLDGPRFEDDQGARLERMREALVGPLLATTAIASPCIVEIRAHGRAGFAALLTEAEHVLHSIAERVIIIAVESYVDPHALMWLGEAERLKDDENPVGLIPGEAAVAVCLTRPGRDRQHSRPCWARITRAGDAGDMADDQSRGRALGHLLGELLDGEVAELYSDLNGETWLAQALGLSLSFVPPNVANALTVRHVAAELGDTGEVSAMLNLCIAARSLQRGYARGRAALVSAQNIDGPAVAVRVERSST
jgi:3-oxoacyl-[acyl-carrier-protein] synthase-1